MGVFLTENNPIPQDHVVHNLEWNVKHNPELATLSRKEAPPAARTPREFVYSALR